MTIKIFNKIALNKLAFKTKHYLIKKFCLLFGILNVILFAKLLNNSFASCFLINLDFFTTTYIAQFDNIIVLPLLVPEIFGFMFSVFFYTLNNKITLFHTYTFCLIILSMPLLIRSSIKEFFQYNFFEFLSF